MHYSKPIRGIEAVHLGTALGILGILDPARLKGRDSDLLPPGEDAMEAPLMRSLSP
jgi:hypothetical protein